MSCVWFALALQFSGCQISPVNLAQVQAIKRQEPIPLPSDAKPFPIHLSTIATRIPLGDPTGQIHYGWVCAGGAKTAWSGGQLALSGSELTRVFRDELLKLKYTVVDEPDSVFENRSELVADYLVGAMITKVDANVCYPFSGNSQATIGATSQVKGGVFLRVTWELYNRIEGRVVFRITTEGATESPELIGGGVRVLLLRAFRENMIGLLSNPEFQKHVLTDPRQNGLKKELETGI